MADDSFLDALVYYRTIFPTLASLGEAAATWHAAVIAISEEAFDPITGTSVNLEGGSIAGVVNFRQKYKVRALHARRAELDPSYENPYLLAAEEPMRPRRLGFTVRFCP